MLFMDHRLCNVQTRNYSCLINGEIHILYFIENVFIIKKYTLVRSNLCEINDNIYFDVKSYFA